MIRSFRVHMIGIYPTTLTHRVAYTCQSPFLRTSLFTLARKSSLLQEKCCFTIEKFFKHDTTLTVYLTMQKVPLTERTCYGIIPLENASEQIFVVNRFKRFESLELIKIPTSSSRWDAGGASAPSASGAASRAQHPISARRMSYSCCVLFTFTHRKGDWSTELSTSMVSHYEAINLY